MISQFVPTGPDPYPKQFDKDLIEDQADAAEECIQDKYREFDWGDPGKQHGPDLEQPDEETKEINRYDD